MDEKQIMVNKYVTKEYIKGYGLRTPETYFLGQKITKDIIDWLPDEFVIKHVDGSSGDCVLVLKRDQDDQDKYIDPIGNVLTVDDLVSYEHKWKSRTFLVEERIHSHPKLVEISEVDDAFIDFRSYIKEGRYWMSRMRVPTKSSGGLANTCRGARVFNINHGNSFVSDIFHGEDDDFIEVPYYREMEESCDRIGKIFNGIDFYGVDGTIDPRGKFIVTELECVPKLHLKDGVKL
ncbi:MAG: hypothetical protein GF317_07615 [Candidatus Lokiarchaeota archaeon]|nr:hypothetical protein [Candidatus Lokiarchaeota archaeon]MBD3199579.1 hypothetical protein [Candidatus Lokiarchaeota archaeon]